MDKGIFKYHDIFANMGIEYLLLVIFLIAMFGFWRFLNMDADR